MLQSRKHSQANDQNSINIQLASRKFNSTARLEPLRPKKFVSDKKHIKPTTSRGPDTLIDAFSRIQNQSNGHLSSNASENTQRRQIVTSKKFERSSGFFIYSPQKAELVDKQSSRVRTIETPSPRAEAKNFANSKDKIRVRVNQVKEFLASKRTI